MATYQHRFCVGWQRWSVSQVCLHPWEPHWNQSASSQCSQSATYPFTHADSIIHSFCHSGSPQALSRSKYSETLLVLYGQYSSIFILDSSSLDTLCVLRSSCKPNWNAQISFVVSPDKKGQHPECRCDRFIFPSSLPLPLSVSLYLSSSIPPSPSLPPSVRSLTPSLTPYITDHLFSLTVDGVAKMWVLPTRAEMKELGEMSEEKTTNLSIQNPLHMASCVYGNYSATLVVCQEVWQVSVPVLGCQLAQYYMTITFIHIKDVGSRYKQ